jgi:Zn-dependent protease with chaperone function
MLPDFAGRILLLVVIAATPAAVRWFLGRRVIRHANDPALAERLLAMARRSTPASVLAIAALLILSPRSAFWTLPLLVLLRLTAGYPIRRALFGETWSLPRYLSFFVRLMIAVYGLWIGIAMLPVIVALAGRWEWAAALLLACVFIAWNLRAADVVRWMMRSAPLPDSASLERFKVMARAAAVPAPRFEIVRLRGGVLANALALPDTRAPSVLFSDSLFAELNESEAAAICAHELAHLEYYGTRRVRAMHLVTSALVVSGAISIPVARALGMPALWFGAAWYVTLFALATWRARHRQRNETASDLRAVALCGDPDALVRALTKLYTLARVPRRLDPHYERQATHPSLARRLRDIRRAAGAQPASLQQSASFAAPGRSTVVTFEPAHLQWSEGEAATHTLSYSHLVEVRIVAAQSGPARIVVVERGGRRWTMPLEGSDLERAQSVLDVVDGQIGDAPLPSIWPRVARLVTAIAAVLALLIGQVAAALLALAVSVRPTAMLLAAAGVGAITGGALTLRDVGLQSRMSPLAMAAAVAGAGVLVLSRGARGEADDTRKPLPLLALAAAAAIAVFALFFAGIDPISVHQSARLVSSATVLPLALGAALALSRRRARQLAAFGALAVGALVATAASPWFLDRFGHDPLLVRAIASTLQRVQGSTLRQFSVPFFAAALRFSPSGAGVALTEETESDEEEMTTFHVGVIGSPLVPVKADDLAFVDDEHVLLLVKGREDLELREIDLKSPDEVLWRQQLPLLAGPALSFDASEGSWRVTGWTRARAVVRLQARIGAVAFDETRWTRHSTDGGYINAVASSADRAVLVESRYDFGILPRPGLRFWAILPFTLPKTESRFWSLATRGGERVQASRFGAQCVVGTASERLVCSVFDGTTTRVVGIDATGQIAPVASFTGRFFCRQSAGADWVTGWWDSTPLALRLSTGRSIQIDGPRGEWIADIAPDNRTAATIGYGESGSVVRLHALSPR